MNMKRPALITWIALASSFFGSAWAQSNTITVRGTGQQGYCGAYPSTQQSDAAMARARVDARHKAHNACAAMRPGFVPQLRTTQWACSNGLSQEESITIWTCTATMTCAAESSATVVSPEEGRAEAAAE